MFLILNSDSDCTAGQKTLPQPSYHLATVRRGMVKYVSIQACLQPCKTARKKEML